jgi:hypothetical protein
VRDEILSYHEMVGREGRSLQAGMNYHVRPGYSILLMSTRRNAPYNDRWDSERDVLIYEGHDAKKETGGPDPKTLDQPLALPSGRPTPNGKFYAAAKRAASQEAPPESVRVYEKLDSGVWSDKGMFCLTDAQIVSSGGRAVVEFYLRPLPDTSADGPANVTDLPHTRLIPKSVKVEVWKRDRGRCVICGSTENLHYDHDLPFSKGGTSLTAENVRILCAKHNLQKSDHIE